MSKSAKLAYTPVGIVGGVIAGSIAKSVFEKVWARGHGESAAPTARTRDANWREVLLAAALQGAIFTAVKTGIDRAGAVAFSRWAGAWPGDEPAD